jgi:hypothetical protein
LGCPSANTWQPGKQQHNVLPRLDIPNPISFLFVSIDTVLIGVTPIQSKIKVVIYRHIVWTLINWVYLRICLFNQIFEKGIFPPKRYNANDGANQKQIQSMKIGDTHKPTDT